MDKTSRERFEAWKADLIAREPRETGEKIGPDPEMKMQAPRAPVAKFESFEYCVRHHIRLFYNDALIKSCPMCDGPSTWRTPIFEPEPEWDSFAYRLYEGALLVNKDCYWRSHWRPECY